MKTSPIDFIYQNYINFMTISNNHIPSLCVCTQSPSSPKLLSNTFYNTYSEILLLLLWSKIQKLITYSYSQPGGSAGKESAAMWETWVRSLGWKDILEKEKVTYSSILAWRISWTTVHGGNKELDITE